MYQKKNKKTMTAPHEVDAVWLFIGPRLSGKTSIVHELLYRTHDVFDVAFADVGTPHACSQKLKSKKNWTAGNEFSQGTYTKNCKKKK